MFDILKMHSLVYTSQPRLTQSSPSKLNFVIFCSLFTKIEYNLELHEIRFHFKNLGKIMKIEQDSTKKKSVLKIRQPILVHAKINFFNQHRIDTKL